MQHITGNCHKYRRPRKSCYIAQDLVHPRKSRLKREVRSKRRQSSHVMCTCCAHSERTRARAPLWYTCTVSSHVRCTSPYTREHVLRTYQRARTITFSRRRYAPLTMSRSFTNIRRFQRIHLCDLFSRLQTHFSPSIFGRAVFRVQSVNRGGIRFLIRYTWSNGVAQCTARDVRDTFEPLNWRVV